MGYTRHDRLPVLLEHPEPLMMSKYHATIYMGNMLIVGGSEGLVLAVKELQLSYHDMGI